MNIFIEGNREHFVSKAAIDKFKKDARESKNLDTIDISKYLKDGITFNFSKTDTSITATIVEIKNKIIEDKRQLLRNRLKEAQRVRTGEQFKQLDSLKRTVPDKLYKSYTSLIKTYAMPNIPNPLEAIENKEKYRQQISMVMGMKGMVSNEPRANNAIKKYFNELGQFLGIEPTEININEPTLNEPTLNEPTLNEPTSSDEEDVVY